MLEYDFMLRAFGAGILIAILSSIGGLFILLRRYSMIGETLAHASLVGVAVALVAELSTIWSAALFALLAAWGVEMLRGRLGLYSDAALALMLAGSLALAVIIVSVGGAFNSSLFAYLFGSILTVSNEDLLIILLAVILLLPLLLANGAKLFAVAYDEEVAKASGVNVGFLNLLLISIIAVIVSLSIHIVGSLLVGALMIIPAMAALRFRRGFRATLLLSLLFSLLGVVGGMSASYYLSTPSGATITLCIILLFFLSVLLNRR